MMQDRPFFSVVVPTYNRADLIIETIRSLQKQDYEHYEIIVVDDGSTDNTEEVIRKLADHRTRYFKKANAERAAARNYGAREAKGDYVNFFDSDDLALPNHLAEAAKVIAQRSNPEWLHVGYAWATTEREVFRTIDYFSGETLNEVLPKGNPLSCNSVFLRKDIILGFPFNENRALSASEDYELWLRLGARFPLYYSNAVTSWIIDHDARSVRKIDVDKLLKRFELLLASLQSDPAVMNVYKEQYPYIKMDSNSYIAVHLADRPAYKLKSLRYLSKAFADNPRLVTTKRFYATIKNVLTKW